MKLYKWIMQGYLDYQYGKFEDIPKEAISYEEVKNKKDIQKLLKNKENYGEYYID